MNKIPIVFAFDRNLIFPASICISSLMMHSNENTFYDIYILHSQKDDIDFSDLNKIPLFFSNCNITYKSVGSIFDNAFEIRGITTPAYYRLLIPEIIPEYDKIFYSDVDVIFRMDLSELYQLDIEDKYIAATRDLGLNLSGDGINYIRQLESVTPGEYIQSGFIMLNSKLLREDGVVERFKNLSKRKLKFQDQDILNIACVGKIAFISLKYNMTDYSFLYSIKGREKLYQYYSDKEIEDALSSGILHYNGHKPWKKYSVNFDVWWEYYRKSPFFDNQVYFDFYYSRLNEYDQLSLWKRIKILIRYFIIKR